MNSPPSNVLPSMLALQSELPKQDVRAILEGLRASNYSQLRTIAVEDSDGGILLRGRVRSYFMKQMAYVTAVNAVGGAPIRDEIVVGTLG